MQFQMLLLLNMMQFQKWLLFNMIALLAKK